MSSEEGFDPALIGHAAMNPTQPDMNAGELCNREFVFAYRDTPLVEAARLMREHHVGSLVVVLERLGERVPVGLLTDRDIVVAVVANGLDERVLTAGDVMSTELVTLREQDGISEVLRLMRDNGVRRVVVLTGNGALAGIVAIDDILELVAEQMDTFARTLCSEHFRETRARH